MLSTKVLQMAQDTRDWVKKEYDLEEDHDMSCYCLISSVELYQRLVKAGYTPKIHVAQDYHVFLSLDRHIVDITATQFTRYYHKPVEIVHMLHKASYQPHWQMDETFTDLNVFLETCETGNDRWPSDQLPSKKHQMRLAA